MRLGSGEPEAGPWLVVPVVDLATRVERTARGRAAAAGRRPVIAVDGRSSSGKSTLARRMAGARPGTHVVSTDDVAWWHSCFDWVGLLVGGVLEPWRRGEDVTFRPPAWERRGREGSIQVPGASDLLIVEGVGSGRHALHPLLDAVVYVQVDVDDAAARTQGRIAAGEVTASVDASWMLEEVPFMAQERPWERADLVVTSTAAASPFDPDREILLSRHAGTGSGDPG